MVIRVLKGGVFAIVAFVAVMFALIITDKFQKPMYTHALLASESLGIHYFVNDIVGISPRREHKPNAYILSHSSRAAVLVSDHAAQYKLSPADPFGLTQDPVYPGWGAVTDHDRMNSVLHLDYLHTMIVGTVDPENEINASRSVDIVVPWSAVGAAFGEVELVRSQIPDGTGFTVLIKGPGSFWIETYPPPSDGFPIMFSLHGFRPGEVMVGADHVRVLKDHFKLATRDFHSLARTELDGDAGGVFSVVRGGMRGRIDRINPDARDLLVDMDTNSDVAMDYPGFLKHGCPGRQSAWVDIDSDNDLDLYVVCGRPKEPNKQFPNQLFVNYGTYFIENAAQFGIDIPNYGTFRFIDWDKDLDPDLIWIASNGDLVFYENVNGEYHGKYLTSGYWNNSVRSPQLLVHDLEMDGDPDLLIVHPDGNVLLVNENSRPVLQKPSKFGLPDKAMVGHWADVNLDGKIDLLTATRGIYIGAADSRFHQQSGVLSSEHFVHDARLVSFAGSEGRAFLVGYRICLPGKLCGVRRELLGLFRRVIHLPYDWYDKMGLFEPYDWFLQTVRRKDFNDLYREVSISVQGPSLNPESIGARIDLLFDSSKESHWVGETDSALYSRGDYNIYLTIPYAISPTAKVFWQDGCVSFFPIPLNSRHVKVPRPASCSQ